MKSRIKRQRKGDSSREKGKSHLAQEALQQESDILQFQTFSNSFLYPLKPTPDEREEKLTTWIPNTSKQEPFPQPAKQSKMSTIKEKMPVKSDIFLNKNGVKVEKYNHRFCQTREKQVRKPAKARYLKTETPRTRCAISLINPKFNNQPVETVASPHQTSCYFSNNPMRDSFRERKALFIRKIKRDLIHGFESRSAQRRHNHSSQREKQDQTSRKQTIQRPLKCCTEIELNFCNNKLTMENQRLYRQELIVKIEPPNSQKHSRTVKNRIFMNPKAYCDNQCEPNYIRLTEQFQKLKSLLKRQKNVDT